MSGYPQTGLYPLSVEEKMILVAGPCVIEPGKVSLQIAEELQALTCDLPVQLIFKASYLKANRSHPDSYAGPGLEEGLAELLEIKEKTGLPLLSDVHCRTEVDSAAEVLDILQIPAYLCRQTPLITKVAEAGKGVNIKKGQFMAPGEMEGAVLKVTRAGNERLILTERGTLFGYNNLTVDFRSMGIMKEFGFPVLFDGTHSVQRPGSAGTVSGGDPGFIFPLCRAAAAVGCDGFYLEVHHDPANALSDAATMLPIGNLRSLLEQVLRIREVISDAHRSSVGTERDSL